MKVYLPSWKHCPELWKAQGRRRKLRTPLSDNLAVLPLKSNIYLDIWNEQTGETFLVSDTECVLTLRSRSCWNSMLWIHSHYLRRSGLSLRPCGGWIYFSRHSGGDSRWPSVYGRLSSPKARKNRGTFTKTSTNIHSPCCKQWWALWCGHVTREHRILLVDSTVAPDNAEAFASC